MTRRNRFPRLSWALVLLLLVVCAGHVDAAPESPAVRVLPLQGETVAGQLASLTADAVAVDTVTGMRALPLDRVRRVEVRSTLAPQLSSAPHLRVHLTGGEILLGTFAGSIDDGLVLETPDLGRLTLLLDIVKTIVPVPADAGVCFEPEQTRRPTDDDIAYVASGDSISGIVLAVTPEGLTLETSRGRERKVAWDDLQVLHLQNDLVEPGDGLEIEIETVEGARLLAASSATLEDGKVRLALRSMPKRTLTLDVFRMRALRPSGGAFVYASDLPFESRVVPYYPPGGESPAHMAKWFETRTDRRPAPNSCPLRLAGITYRHGFAVQSKSIVTIPLDAKWATFDVIFGVDDLALEVPDGGIVDARVLGDGKVLWEAKDVKAGEAPRTVGPIDVKNVRTLELVVDFGKKLYRGDRATWADPVLVRKP